MVHPDNNFSDRHVVVLSTADFDSDVWTNKQHLASGLSSLCRITYVGSVGLRRPRLNRNDAARLVRRLFSKRKREANPSFFNSTLYATGDITIVRPMLVPFHDVPIIYRLNKRLLKLQLRKVLDNSTFVLWTFSPLTFGLEDLAESTVYHSVDLLHEVPGVPKDTVLSGEARLCAKADAIIASSAGVQSHLQRMSREARVLLWENVAFIEEFLPRGEERIQRAIFAGHLTSSKVRLGYLRAIIRSGCSVAVAGPVSVDGTRADAELSDLFSSETVTYLGNLSVTDLAREIRRSMVGIIPYQLNGYTAGVFPMKVYEYLSAGLSVVAAPLPSLRDKAVEGLQLEQDEARFAKVVQQELLNFNEAEATSRSEGVRSKSWANRISQTAELIGTLATK